MTAKKSISKEYHMNGRIGGELKINDRDVKKFSLKLF